LRLAPLIVIAILLAVAPVPQASLEEPVRIGYRVAVVVFDPEGVIDEGRLQSLVDQGLGSLQEVFQELDVTGPEPVPVRIDPRVEVDIYMAEPWAVAGLSTALQGLYVDDGVPEWAPGWFEPPAGYAWLDVVEAYHAIWDWSVRVVRSGGGDPALYNGVVVIIGDLDGKSRIYYRQGYYPYVPGQAIRVEGLRAWGGLEAMTFYDLSTLVKPWPSYRVPFDTEAPPASPETEPPIWALPDPTGYAAGLVVDEIIYHVVGLGGWPTTHQSIEAKILVLDFGDPETTQALVSQLDPEEIRRLTLMLAPWLDLDINITVMQAPDALQEAYQDARARGVPVPLPFETVAPETASLADDMLGDDPRIGDPSLEATWIFIVLATPDPAYLQWRGNFNFTGFSAGWYGVTSYPGWDDRVLRSGLPAVVAHELGHSLGEGHPFQLPNGTIRWLMDMQATIMSYMDYGRIAYGDVYNFSAQRLSLYQAIAILTLLPGQVPGETAAEALDLIAEGRHTAALQLIREALGYGPTPETTTVTETITETITKTITTTTTITATEHYTETKTIRETITKTETQTITTSMPGPDTTTTQPARTIEALPTWALIGLGAIIGLIAGLALRRG